MANKGLEKEKKSVVNAVAVVSQRGLDKVEDMVDKVSSPTSRSGNVLNRIATLSKAGLAPDVTALQMKKSSVNNYNYTPRDIAAFTKLYEDCKTKPPLTAQATRALIKDQTCISEEAGAGSEQRNPETAP